jgi:YbbR domain-containing protein
MTSLLRRLLLHNFWLKILSLVIATGLWLAISPDQEPAEVAVRVPIELQHIPSQLEISSVTIPEAQIRVRGPERLVRELRSTEIHADLELKDATPGERTFELTAQQIRHPRELIVVQVVPGQVHLSFDTRLSREVEIHPRITGNVAAGYQISQVLADPPRTTISGPSHHVEMVQTADTDPIDVSGAKEQATYVTNAYVPDPLVQVMQPVPVRVTVILQKGAAKSDLGKDAK